MNRLRLADTDVDRLPRARSRQMSTLHAHSRLPRPLCGIVPPVATPLLGRDELDVAGLERLIEHLIAGGVQGLFILGTTGEALALSYRLRAEMIQRTCEIVSKRLPVLVGITDTSLVEALHLADIAATCDADAVVTAPPFYQPFSQSQLQDYCRALIDELALPLFLYNMPALTKVWFDHATLRELSAYPQIVGLKDSSGDLDYLREAVRIVARRPDFSVLIGPEHLLAEALTFGVKGGVCGGGNVFPELFVWLCRAHAAGDRQGYESARIIIDHLQGLYRLGKTPAAVIQGVKGALALRGLCGDQLAAPIHPLSGSDRDRVAELLAEVSEQMSAQLTHVRA